MYVCAGLPARWAPQAPPPPHQRFKMPRHLWKETKSRGHLSNRSTALQHQFKIKDKWCVLNGDSSQKMAASCYNSWKFILLHTFFASEVLRSTDHFKPLFANTIECIIRWFDTNCSVWTQQPSLETLTDFWTGKIKLKFNTFFKILVHDYYAKVNASQNYYNWFKFHLPSR